MSQREMGSCCDSTNMLPCSIDQEKITQHVTTVIHHGFIILFLSNILDATFSPNIRPCAVRHPCKKCRSKEVLFFIKRIHNLLHNSMSMDQETYPNVVHGPTILTSERIFCNAYMSIHSHGKTSDITCSSLLTLDLLDNCIFCYSKYSKSFSL